MNSRSFKSGTTRRIRKVKEGRIRPTPVMCGAVQGYKTALRGGADTLGADAAWRRRSAFGGLLFFLFLKLANEDALEQEFEHAQEAVRLGLERGRGRDANLPDVLHDVPP